MKSDPKLPRAALKLLVAIKSHPGWDVGVLIERAAEAHGVDPQILRKYAEDDLGLIVEARKEELVYSPVPVASKGR